MKILPIFDMNSVKRLLFIVFFTSLSSCGGGGDGGTSTGVDTKSVGVLSINWVAPTEREDGTPIMLSEIEAYNIYYGNNPSDYGNQVDNAEVTLDSVYIPDFPSGTYYFVVTTVTTGGQESRYSEEFIIVV